MEPELHLEEKQENNGDTLNGVPVDIIPKIQKLGEITQSATPQIIQKMSFGFYDDILKKYKSKLKQVLKTPKKSKVIE